MRTLLVDNYDSFTHNLAHYLAEVSGCAPAVLRNDDPALTPGLLAEFDNVVVSPGPGTPEHETDLGLARELIDRCDRPLLGVCLGHQAIAHQHGAKVRRADEPRHGRTSPVEHGGTGLFAGLPSPFRAVRYHSLAVTDLPEELLAMAWTPDGVLMGLRHRTRPLWGVQFHPESIRTEHGHQLLRNFVDLTPARPRPVITTGRDASTEAGLAPSTRPAEPVPVHVRRMPTSHDPEVVFDQLFRPAENAFWLDSNGIDRFSIMGSASRRVTATDGSFFDWLAGELGTVRAVADVPFDFTLGWIGYLGYELKSECGGDAVHESPYPDAAMMFADHAVVFDHAEDTTYVLALDPAKLSLLDAVSRVDMPTAEACAPAPISLRHNRGQYFDAVTACQQAIVEGETYEVNLTNRITVEADVDPWPAYRFLRRTSPAPFGALLKFGDLHVLSTSPERFLRIDADGVVESKPIKGTRPRGQSPGRDAELREELRTSEKDRSESLMIVDLVRNDLARVAEVGSVRVTSLFDVESYATVHQLVSTITARLRPDASPVDCVRAAFPPGSMTGAPKIRTMKIIDRLEGSARGVYSGAVGYFSLNGAVDLSVVIRTAVVTPGQVDYGVGGAVVALSDPDDEYEETAVKATPLLGLFQAEFPDRVI
ncbi:aminodeoxychorismate synthase component I [Kutzneria sp. CA-103260]|uniref:aminodeoxychorismate synthase component I n=1 Tax=Kutzneria sp. CA-103260 TaxID=2802641 RepID=UPI001BADA235|nr:aminodeoxychorismate synthase component I [Kutzneria sp. CA-103260]QUQ71114.1 aminodeoxychorismate synthase [Kutzneria sp. CA-103260]